MTVHLAQEVVALVVAVLALIAVIGRIGWNVHRWARRMETAIAYVESEMRFDGGATTRDAIARIERHLGVKPGNGWDGYTNRRNTTDRRTGEPDT